MSDVVSAGARILCLNTGSSSVKFAVFALGDREERLASGAIEEIGAHARLWVEETAKDRVDQSIAVADAAAAVHAALDALGAAPSAVGHRVVHGGPDHAAPELVDDAFVDDLRALVPFAPLHLPAVIDAIAAVRARFPGLPQVACFDTAFHRDMPIVARRLPLRRSLFDEGLRRYGFHGLSYEYVVAAVGATTLGRAVIAHLGNGASLAAVRDGAPVDTTMGFTPSGGVMMGTRSGDLDPGVVLHLLRRGWDATSLERLIDADAGLLGVSATSADMKTLLAARERDPRAAEAVAMFCYRVRLAIGAFAAALGGLDTLVFTGGIGERAAPVRREVCEQLGHLGIRLDPERNAAHAPIVSTPDAPCTVRVVPTDEELVIARHTAALLARDAGRK